MPSPKIVLTADRTLMSPYRKLSLATFFGCAPALDPHRDPKSFWYKILGRQVTPKILFDFICNYIPHTNGVADYAPYGLRKVEAGLLRDGFKREEVVVAHPDHIEKFIGPHTEVVGTYEMDPLGMGPVTMTFTYGRKQMSYDEFYNREMHQRINAAKEKTALSSKVTEVSSSPDLHVIQSINTLDEVDKVCNALSSRLREWYGLHFPELDGIAGYSKIVTTGRREDLNEDAFTKAGFPESKVNMLNVVQEKSRGGEISDENLEIVKSLAQRMLDMLDLRKNLEDHLEKEMNNVAPNLAIILGTGVAARMLSRTGSLKKLSSLPASTIQALGQHCNIRIFFKMIF